MTILYVLIVLISGYILGSIPFGVVIVKIASGKDVRLIGSGRVGGTNVMRAAGFFAGFLTGVLDVCKGILTARISDLLLPGNELVKVLGVALVVLGQIHSIFLIEKNADGKIHLRGGAGGAASLGSAMALWFPAWMFIIPLGVFVYIFVGYASLTTITIALVGLIIFIVRYILGLGPWQHILFSVMALGLVLYALQPNLVRLKNGTERMVGLRAYRAKKKEELTK